MQRSAAKEITEKFAHKYQGLFQVKGRIVKNLRIDKGVFKS